MILYNPTVSGSLVVTGSLTTTGTITSQTLVVQTITSSIEFNTGSTRNGTLLTNTHEFTGSVSITGSAAALLNVNNGVLYVSASGNVGIGTVSPDALLTVAGTNQATGGAYNTYGNVLIHSTDSYAINKGGAISFGGKYYSASTIIATFARIHGKKESATDGATSGYLSFETTLEATAILTERMRITSTGKVGIGTITPSVHSKLSVAGGISFNNNTDSTVADNRYGNAFGKQSSVTAGGAAVVIKPAVGSEAALILVSGYVVATGNRFADLVLIFGAGTTAPLVIGSRTYLTAATRTYTNGGENLTLQLTGSGETYVVFITGIGSNESS